MQRIFLILLLLFSGFSGLSAMDPFYFVIRVDDIQSRISWTPRSITDFETAVEARAAKISWAVIPHRLIESQNTDGILTRDLIQSVGKGHEIILHGYNHICPLCGQSGHEMFCAANNVHHSYDTQLEMIENGLQILTDSLNVRPSCFVPPGHHADTTTYRVLLDKGFEFISTTGTTGENIFDELYNLGAHNEYTWYLNGGNYVGNLQAALDDIEAKRQSDGYYCLLLHDPFIRAGYENGLVIDWTAELLDSLRARYGRALAFVTLSEAAIFRSETDIVARKDPVPEKIRLLPNYPNPFNPSTVVPYFIPAAGRVRLSVYNLLGQEVAVLVNRHQKAGLHFFEWHGKNVSSGIYFLRLQCGNYLTSRKCMVSG